MSLQLTEATGYDTKNVVFSDPIPGSIPNSKIQFKRIMIKTKHPNGQIGDLILPTERLYSFGVNKNVSQETGKVTGYTMPMCMWSKDNCSKEEKTWTDTLTNIVERCKDHLVENRDDLEKWDLDHSDLKKLNPLYFKREKGKIVEGLGPKLYPKLIVSRKARENSPETDGIISYFYDKDDTKLNPLDLIGSACFVNAAIKIESIFIGSKITLQVKLFECDVELVQKQGRMRKLLRGRNRPEVNKEVSLNPLIPTKEEDSDADSDNEDEKKSVKSESEKEVESEKTPSPKSKTDDDNYVSDESEEEEKPKKVVKKRGRKPKKQTK